MLQRNNSILFNDQKKEVFPMAPFLGHLLFHCASTLISWKLHHHGVKLNVYAYFVIFNCVVSPYPSEIYNYGYFFHFRNVQKNACCASSNAKELRSGLVLKFVIFIFFFSCQFFRNMITVKGLIQTILFVVTVLKTTTGETDRRQIY